MKIKFGDSSLNLKAGGSLANIDRGPRGYSAYEIAVQEGFVGTEEEWLASLVGPEGKQGKDGERGLEGPRGKEGPEGKQGIPGYTPVKGIDYFTEADIESLDIPKKTSDIQNDSGFIDRSVNNLVNYTLKTNTGSLIDLSIDNTNYVVTLKLKNQDGTVISTDNIDLPLESVVVGGSYDKINKKIVLTLENGNKVDIPVGDLIAGLQTEITSSNKLASDLVDDTNSGNKFTNMSEKQAWNNKYDKPSSGIPATDLSGQVQTSLGKADTALQEHQDLTDYVKNTDYASDNKAGVTKNGNAFVVTNTNGVPYCSSDTYAQYQSSGNGRFISKGTLENVIAGKGLTTKSYVDGELEDKVDSDAYVQEQEVQDSNIEENASNIDWLQTLVNQMPTVSGQGTDLSLQSVLNYRLMKFLPQGGSSQDGEPTPTTPIPVKSVTGENSLILQSTNLFDKNSSNWLQTYIGQTSYAIGTSTSNTNFKTIYIKCLPNTNYYIKKFVGTGSLAMGTTELEPTLGMTLNDYIFANATNCAFLTGENANYLVVQISTNTDINNGYTVEEITNNLSITKGSTAPSTYVEYEEQNYQLSLGNIELNSSPDGTIRDQIVGKPNEWYKREYIGKVVFDGSENWGNLNMGAYYKRTNVVLPSILKNISTRIICLSNYFKYNDSYKTDIIGTCFISNGDNRLYLYPAQQDTLASFKTWLQEKYEAGNPVIVWYPLAQYIDIPITDTTLISQLNDFYNNAHSYNGVTNITTTYEDGNEQMYLDIEALKNVWEVTE